MSERQPSLRPTQPATLVVAGLAAAAVAWLLISNFYQDLPPMIWAPVVVIGGLAAFEAVAAWQVWIRIHQRDRLQAARQRGSRGGPVPGREPLDPLAVARYAVLAKASALAGAIFAGFYAGYLPWLLVESGRLASAAEDLPPTVGGLVVSAAFIAAALWLERSCRVPEREDGDDTESGTSNPE